MEKVMADHAKPGLSWPFGWDVFVAGQEYWRDSWERSILFLDVLRQRGNNYVERTEQTAPHVLTFAAEVVMDGRKLDRPVNYALVRIVPPEGTEIDPHKRPFIVFDPRAGHGPGTPATLSGSCPNRCHDRRSATSVQPRRASSRKLLPVIPMRKGSRC